MKLPIGLTILVAGLALASSLVSPASAESTDAERAAAAAELDLIDAEMRIRCPHTMPDVARASCLRDRYRENRMGHTNLRWGEMPRRYQNLLVDAVDRYRANNREALTDVERARSNAEWARSITNDTDCVVIQLKMGCVRQAQLDHQDDWTFVGKMTLTCGAATAVAIIPAAAGGPPAVFTVGGSTLGLCLFTTLVWAF